MNRFILKFLRRCFLSLSITWLASSYCIPVNGKIASPYFRAELQEISQNALDYLPQAATQRPLISKKEHQQLIKTFLQRYFSPWHDSNHFLENDAMKQRLITALQRFLEQPGWGANHYPLSPKWVQAIEKNMDLAYFPNRQEKGITLYPTDMKQLPTTDLSFGNPDSPGKGYPFDNNQESWVNGNTPVLILHESYDGAWRFVLLGNTFGWLPAQSVATVTDAFIQQWQGTANGYVTMTDLKIPLFNQEKKLVSWSQLGNLYPLVSKNKDTWLIYAANSDAQGQAILQLITVAKSAAVQFPLPLTSYQLALRINKLMALPYSWGGLNGSYDCSSTMVTLFQPFGIWLPRNSSDQAKFSDHFIDLTGMSKIEKLHTIKQRCVPFLTLVWMPGHVMLYIGNNGSKEPYLFNSLWGFKTENPVTKKEGRALITESVIMPCTIDEDYSNIPIKLIDKFERVILLHSLKASKSKVN